MITCLRAVATKRRNTTVFRVKFFCHYMATLGTRNSEHIFRCSSEDNKKSDHWWDKNINVSLFRPSFAIWSAWENSRYLATLPLVSSANKVWVVLRWVESNFLRARPSEARPRSGWWGVISMEYLRSFLRRHFAGKPLVASPNVGWFLRPAIW